MSARMAPTVTQDSQFFWDALKEHRLLIQRCMDCGIVRHPPRPMCPTCQSLKWETVECSGRGTVYSFVMPVYPPLPFIDGEYIVAIVELEEGTRIVTNIVEVAADSVSIGMSVTVRFDAFDGGLVLAMFVPIDAP